MDMTFSSLENSILQEALHKPRTIRELADTYVLHKHLSRSGFYKALASLRKKEVVTIRKRYVSINKIWLLNASDFFVRLQHTKQVPSYLATQIHGLGHGERLEYIFNSITDIDIFILNLFHDLLMLKSERRTFIEQTHEFFVLINQTRTAQILKEIQKLGASVLLLIHSNSTIDKKIVSEHLGTPAQGYVTGKNKITRKITHVVGNTVIELHLAKKFMAGIEHVYTNQTLITQTFIKQLQSLAEKKYRHRIVIYKDMIQARQIATRFRKYFV